MNIKQCARLTGLNPETIRMYREKGLIVPRQNKKNGYYEYRLEDMFSLLHIRQLRSWEMSLKEIRQLYRENDQSGLLESYDQQITSVKAEIRRLESRLTSLELTRQHILECCQTEGAVAEMESIDDKYDLYPLDWTSEEEWERWRDMIDDGTIALRIPADVLNAKELPAKLSIQAGVGTYRMLIRDDFPMAERVVCCPKGHCLSIVVGIDNLSEISSDKIRPMWQYAKDHGYRFVSDTTAFLVRVDTGKSGPRFVFRIRVRVEAAHLSEISG